MSTSKKQEFYFRNFLVIALGLFSGLEYFSRKDLVHRDVKRMCIFILCIYL